MGFTSDQAVLRLVLEDALAEDFACWLEFTSTKFTAGALSQI